MSERIFLTSKDKITVSENNLVSLETAAGEQFELLEPRRLFPLSRKDSFITLLDKDGKEAAVIRELRDLEESSRAVIEMSLDDYYLVPKITKIISKHDKHGTLRWTVETDRGIKTFDIKNRYHDIKLYKNGKVRVRDSDDNRYTIEDYRKLDPKSRARVIADI